MNQSCDPSYNPYLEIGTFCFHLAYSIPTLILNIVLLKVIFGAKTRHALNNSFFNLFAVFTVMNIISFVCSYGFDRVYLYFIPLCPFFKELLGTPAFYLTPVYATSNFVFIGKYLTLTAISVNRLTSVWIPLKHQTLWANRGVIPFLVITPIFFTFQYFISRTYVIPTNGGLAIVYKNAVLWMNAPKVQSFTFSFFLIANVLCSILTLMKIFNLPKRTKKAELALCFVGFIMALCCLLNAILQLLFATLDWRLPIYDVLYASRLFVNDLTSISSPWALLAMSSSLKEVIFKKNLSRSVEPTSSSAKSAWQDSSQG